MRECLIREVEFRTSRSSGPGGQNVNKTESRVELLWSPAESACLNHVRKKMVMERLANRISEDGVMHIVSEKYRSQYRNRTEVTERFLDLVTASIKPVKKRMPTKPTRSSVEKRIRKKRIRGEVKKMRGNKPGRSSSEL